uniref:DNA 3'-5' helicase n=1 Tax=Amphimedon queenslandica TaxID=400682 RepID=A0A1X7VJA5_AMPQE
MAGCRSSYFDDASVNSALLESLTKFGLYSFKEEQKKAITIFLQKKDVFVISPTGLTAVCIGDCEDEDSIIKGEYQLVFVSPETFLVKQKWRRMLGNDVYQERLVALVIDEAHCVRTCIVPKVNIMALTATASDTLVSHIIHDTGMARPEIVSVSPNKENLCFGVQKILSMHETFTPLIQSLQLKRTNFRRTIIFCQQQWHCGQLYQLFRTQMSDDLLDPIVSPPFMLQNRLVDVFCKGTEDLVKDNIASQITKSDSKVRVLICTAACGMGVDCAGVERVIHWGPPNDVESYIQQTGRCGRSGQKSQCILLFTTWGLRPRLSYDFTHV